LPGKSLSIDSANWGFLLCAKLPSQRGINRLLKFADIPSASEPFFEALAALET
jgi:hypothetical protein